MVFTGRNILPGFPSELTKVVSFLKEKADAGEFVFGDSFSYWEENEFIVDSLGLQMDGSGYYFAVALAYVAHLKNGNINFTKEVNVWRWGWSLSILAALAGWPPSYMKRVIDSFAGKKESIDGLMGKAVYTYSRTNYDDGLALLAELPQYRTRLLAGLMENNYSRYCNQYPFNKDPEEFANVFIQTDQLEKENVRDAFDKAIDFPSFSSSSAIAFLLKVHDSLDDDRKDRCEARVKELLRNGNTVEYVSPITNWAYLHGQCSAFMEDCILMLVQGIREENSNFLASVDRALISYCNKKDFLIRLIRCVADNIGPINILKLENCLRGLSKNKEEFLNIVLSFILHPKGMYRKTGRKLWDDYHLETSDFKVSELEEKAQILFIIFMLQDYGNPERRLPKLLPLLTEGSDVVRSILMQALHPYVDEYMGHVTNILDVLNIDCEESKTIRKYVDERGKRIKERREIKELSPLYTYETVFREAMRQQNNRLQKQIREAETNHKSFLNFFSPVFLARGGGWRDENGHTQHLLKTTFSVPARIMAESMSPKEQDEWLNQLIKNWDDTAGDN